MIRLTALVPVVLCTCDYDYCTSDGKVNSGLPILAHNYAFGGGGVGEDCDPFCFKILLLFFKKNYPDVYTSCIPSFEQFSY